jgi:peptidyl-prolyl cis-trans isomerase A (cyclophilin A)
MSFIRTRTPTPRTLRRYAALLALLFVSLASFACKEAPPARQTPLGPTPDSFRVAFTTSRGTFVVQATRAWAPRGVDRFYQLVGDGFFDDGRFYRVIPGFVAQFGANDDPKRNTQWETQPLSDDPRREKNLRGTTSYAFLDPNSRTHQLFVNLKDNPSLDAQGFAPIGRVIEGMSVVDSLYGAYGEKPQYNLIAAMGNRYLARMFPKLDYIETARLVSP